MTESAGTGEVRFEIELPNGGFADGKALCAEDLHNETLGLLQLVALASQGPSGLLFQGEPAATTGSNGTCTLGPCLARLTSGLTVRLPKLEFPKPGPGEEVWVRVRRKHAPSASGGYYANVEKPEKPESPGTAHAKTPIESLDHLGSVRIADSKLRPDLVHLRAHAQGVQLVKESKAKLDDLGKAIGAARTAVCKHRATRLAALALIPLASECGAAIEECGAAIEAIGDPLLEPRRLLELVSRLEAHARATHEGLKAGIPGLLDVANPPVSPAATELTAWGVPERIDGVSTWVKSIRAASVWSSMELLRAALDDDGTVPAPGDDAVQLERKSSPNGVYTQGDVYFVSARNEVSIELEQSNRQVVIQTSPALTQSAVRYGFYEATEPFRPLGDFLVLEGEQQ